MKDKVGAIRKFYPLCTNKQLEALWFIHPDFGGMGNELAAKEIGITVGTLQYRLKNVLKVYPDALRFRDIITPEQAQIAGERVAESEMSSLTQIYGGYKRKAAKAGVPFDLSLDDFYELITLPCSNCGREGYKHGITDDGRHFRYNFLYYMTDLGYSGYTYVNTDTLCHGCMINKFRGLKKQVNY